MLLGKVSLALEWLREQFNAVWYMHEDRSYFHFLRPFQLLTGIPSTFGTQSTKGRLLTYITLVVLNLCSIGHKLNYVQYQTSAVGSISVQLGCFIVNLAAIAQMISYAAHYADFQQLVLFLNERSFARDHPLAWRIRTRWYRWGNFFLVGPQLSILIIKVKEFSMEDSFSKMLMLEVRGKIVDNVFIQKLYSLYATVPALAWVLGCSIIYAATVGLLAEMELLATCLEELDVTVADRLAHLSVVGSFGSRNRNYTALFWKVYREELNMCAKRHSEIFTILSILQQMTSVVFLQFHFVATTVVLSGWYASLIDNNFENNLVIIMFVTILLLLYIIFCLLVEKIQDMNVNIGVQLYGTRWMLQMHHSNEFHHEYRSAVLMILLLLGRSQQRIRFTCGSYGEISMVKFTEFINLIYSFMTFLLSIN
ncbi:uncharacterized protein LOC118459891 [Anopheles albimanus]|uniref:Uncharacterized protein n=1 Tax=Anopheles albimanus TaxID=7167 RepID=A0A182FZN6_ANOAL|nr:uncharacterized protein LOC118459891 [Anopheles albimanus]